MLGKLFREIDKDRIGTTKQVDGLETIIHVRWGAGPAVPDKPVGQERLACFFLTDVVKCGEAIEGVRMKEKKGERKKQMKSESVAQVRATLSFPPDVYETLKTIAKHKKVSLAWVVREATEQYLAEKWPLFKGQG